MIYIPNVWLKPCPKRLLIGNRRSMLWKFLFLDDDQWGSWTVHIASSSRGTQKILIRASIITTVKRATSNRKERETRNGRFAARSRELGENQWACNAPAVIGLMPLFCALNPTGTATTTPGHESLAASVFISPALNEKQSRHLWIN
jgi:hypothetical protein